MADVVKEKLAVLRGKLDQIPALQQAEVSSVETPVIVTRPVLGGEAIALPLGDIRSRSRSESRR